MKKITIIFLQLFLLSTILIAQERWMKIYHDDDNATRANMIKTYDNGILITGRIKPNWPRNNYLIKTDINGEVLWEKTLGDGYNIILPGGLGMNTDGDIYFSGSYGMVGSYDDPMIMKLNACGEKEWCWLFPTVGYHDYGFGLTVTLDEGVAFIIGLSGNPSYDDRICLARFTSEGAFLWKKCYNLADNVAMDNEIANEVITTPDSGFLITGYTRYSNPEDSVGYFCPYYIKTDSLGDMEWHTIAGFHPFDVDGSAFYTTLSPDSNYYYSAIRHNHWNNRGGSSPALLKLNLQGDIVDVYDIVVPHEEAKMQDVKFINDTTLAASAFWGSVYNQQIKAVVLDTLGNILDQTILLVDAWMPSIEVAKDDKLLYFMEDLDENEEFDAYLFKLNQDLESDSIYTQWYNYDSLCPYQITSDTIPIEGCGLIVGMEEIKAEVEEEEVLRVFPNPTSMSFKILLSSVAGKKLLSSGGKLEVANLMGQTVLKINSPKGIDDIEVDVSGWKKGVYIISLQINKGASVKTKVVVE